MNIIDALVFAIVEGITEFLPISSTGHLILTSKLISLDQTEFLKTFEIFIQLGAILSVIVLYKDLLMKNRLVWRNILAGFLPTAIIGFVLFKIIKTFLLGNLYVTLIALFLGGVLLIFLEKLHKPKSSDIATIDKLSIKTSILIGLCQSVSVIPGVSRSAASILGAMFLGVKRETAVEYSFLLAIPTMLAASGLDLVKSEFDFSANELTVLFVGFMGSFIVALLAVKYFIKYIRKHSFAVFGMYRIVLALVFWLLVIR